MKAIPSSTVLKRKIKIIIYLSLVWSNISFILAFYEKEIVRASLSRLWPSISKIVGVIMRDDGWMKVQVYTVHGCCIVFWRWSTFAKRSRRIIAGIISTVFRIMYRCFILGYWCEFEKSIIFFSYVDYFTYFDHFKCTNSDANIAFVPITWLINLLFISITILKKWSYRKKIASSLGFLESTFPSRLKINRGKGNTIEEKKIWSLSEFLTLQNTFYINIRLDKSQH